MEYLFVTYQFKIGGVENVFLKDAELLQKKIFLAPAHKNYDKDLIKNMPDNVSVIDNEKKINKSIPGLLRAISWGKKLRKKLPEDIIPINFSDTLTTLIIAKAVDRKHYISWIHCSPYELLTSRTNKLYFYLLRHAEYIVFICKSQRDLFYSLPQTQNFDRKKAVICTDIINVDDVRRLAAERVDIPEKYILTVSRIDFRTKDYETLIKAYKHLSDEFRKEYPLLIVGDGPDFDELKKLVEDNNLTENVKLLGNRNNPYPYMLHSTLYIQSSKSEGFSMSILEALACGCNVISSDCNVGPAEILDDGIYGKLYPVGDTQKLSELIKSQINASFDRQKIINRSYELQELGRKQLKDFLCRIY